MNEEILKGFRVDQLCYLCKKNKINYKGIKSVLVKRISDHFNLQRTKKYSIRHNYRYNGGKIFPKFNVTVKRLTGQNCKLKVSIGTTVVMVKEMLSDIYPTPSMIILMFNRKELKHGTYIGEYGMKEGDEIYVVLNL